MRDRRVDLERLARVLQLLLLGQRAERAHVVQPVGELDDDDAHVARHREHHLAVALGLGLLARVEVDARQLGDAVDEQRDVVAELGGDLLERRLGVLDRVVQQRRDDHRGLGAQLGADARDPQRVHDVGLARLAHLVGVPLGGERVGALDGAGVGVVAGRLQRGDQLVDQRPELLVVLKVGACRSRHRTSHGTAAEGSRLYAAAAGCAGRPASRASSHASARARRPSCRA